MPRTCLKCGSAFANAAWVDGRRKNLQNRRYCLACSPFGSHNTRRAGERRRSELTGLTCDRCGRALTTTQQKGRACWNCYHAARSARQLDRAYAIVGETCWRCGYGRGRGGRRLLDFHHVDRATKAFGLDARHVVNLAWSRVTAELRKCVLLCANCHRECEAGLVPAAEVADLHARRWAAIDAGETTAGDRPGSDQPIDEPTA